MDSENYIADLLQEAHTRWLRPAEVLFILQNYESVKIFDEPLQKPISGTLILYNRRVLRFFRKDGHNWQKKESHEHLKVENVDALNCYYSINEENPQFKRRCYWMLNSKAHDHIVLVHYIDSSQVSQNAIDNVMQSFPELGTPSPSLGSNTMFINESYKQNQILSSPGSGEVNSGPIMVTNGQLNTRENTHEVDVLMQMLEDELCLDQGNIPYNDDFLDYNENPDDFDSNLYDQLNANDLSSLPQSGEIDNTYLGYEADIWEEMLNGCESSQNVDSQDNFVIKLENNGLIQTETRNENEDFNILNSQFYGSLSTNTNEDSSSWLPLLENGPTESLYDNDSKLTISQKQKFTIREISPEWGYASEFTKVIIIGSFLYDSSESVWNCMFGDIEVPLQMVQEGVMKCMAPPCLPGKVTLCITSGNRESASEVREFEYRAKSINLPEIDSSRTREEQLLHTKFAQMLLSDKAEAEIDSLSNSRADEESWKQVIEAVEGGTWTSSITTDWLLIEFLKDKLQQWLNSRIRENQGCSLSKKEQGIIHMISGLGFEWALHPILKSGVSVNFRDANGWAPLHWAARFGREKVVAALVASGASTIAVTDPTADNHVGRTPADIASAYGHSGLAGYLSELALTRHLSSLTLKETELSKGSALIEAERTLSNVSSEIKKTDELSLAAVRNTALAAARIQSAFRAHSFRKRELREAAKAFKTCGYVSGDVYSEKDVHKFSKITFRKSRDYNKAAVLIQKKYRGYKGRKDFLAYRKKVVKIQAHIRGYQVRRQYHVTWAVGVLEKVMLRWRRHREGLRGFKVEMVSIDEREDADILKVFRKKKLDGVLDEAVRRVLLMVENPEARQQYRRILMKYRQAKAERGGVEKEQD